MSSTDSWDDDVFDEEPEEEAKVEQDDDDDEFIFLDDDDDDGPPASRKIVGGVGDFDQVVWLMEMGIGVMPVSVEKVPILKKWTTRDVVPVHDVDFMRKKWAELGEPNIGLVLGADCGPGGDVVVEADNDEGEAWLEEHTPPTPTMVKARRGHHRHMGHSGGSVKNRADILGSKVRWDDELEDLGYDIRGREARAEGKEKGLTKKALAKHLSERMKAEKARALADMGPCPYPLIDVKADGGYTVGPGSRHKSGHVYEAIGFDSTSWADRPVFDAEWFPARYKSKHRSKNPIGDDLEDLRRIARELGTEDYSLPYDPDECTPERKMTRATAYVMKCAPSIENNGGHNALFYAACRAYVAFDLTFQQAVDVLGVYNANLCTPEWEEWELHHKLDEADANASEPRGALLFNRPEYEDSKKRREGQGGAIGHEEVIVDEDDEVAHDPPPELEARTQTDDGEELSESDKLKSKLWARYGVDFLELKASGASNYTRQGIKGAVVPAELVNLVAILNIGEKHAGRLAYNELKMRPTLDGKTMEDHNTIDLNYEVDALFRKHVNKEAVKDAVMKTGRLNTFDPVLNYLRSLTWDGEKRLDQLARKVMRTITNEELATVMARKWMISAVARAMEPGCKVDTALILKARQGAWKSMFFEVMFGEFFTAANPDLNQKDALLVVGTTWGWEWAELQHVTKAKNVNMVKSFLSETVDRFRHPYGEFLTDRPRRCSIVGTTNEDAIIYDDTGSRRLWIIEVPNAPLGINIPLAIEWRDQLWAEALHYYTLFRNDGEERYQWWLTADEDAERDRVSGAYQPIDVWTEEIEKFLRTANKVFTAGDVLKSIGVEVGRRNSIEARRVKQMLRQAGCTEKRMPNSNVRGWVPPKRDD